MLWIELGEDAGYAGQLSELTVCLGSCDCLGVQKQCCGLKNGSVPETLSNSLSLLGP